MKTIKTLTIMLFFALSIVATSCKKDKDSIPANTRQTVLDSIERDFTKEISNGSPGAYAVGYYFNTISKGVINQLVLKTPSIGVYKIVIENTDTNAKDSVSMNITAADTGKTIYSGITPMIANAGDYFRITFNDLDKPQYQYLRVGGMAQTYGDIKLRWYAAQAQATSSTIDGDSFLSVNYTFGGVGFTYVKD
jgi:hypothetical protein